MVKVWKFLGILVVVAVCLGLVLGPALTSADPGLDCGIEIEPALQKVGFNATFDVNVTVKNPTARALDMIMCNVSFTPGLLEVTGVDYGATVGSPFTTTMAAPSWSNATGELDYDGGCPPGTSTNLTSIVYATLHMKSNVTSGAATVEFVPVDGWGDPATSVIGVGVDYLNWTAQVVNGTVIIGPAFNLTVTSDGCCAITVGGLGTVAPTSMKKFIVPCPNVNLTADDSGGSCNFTNWTVDSGAPTFNKSVIVSGTANTSHTAVAWCTGVGVATLEGHVSFTGRGAAPNSKWAEPFNVTLFELGNLSHMLWTGNAITNNTGVFTITGLDPGTYDSSVKNWTCLSEVKTGVTLIAGNTTVVDFGTTREGDADNNDHVNILDASSLVGAFGSSQGGPGWNANCDFNRDGNVNILDASALAGNFGEHGDLT